jgi:hypothetical protein
MTIAIISFIGVITGAFLQYLFTQHLENERHYRDLRTQAYMDYLQCVCEQAQFFLKNQSKDAREIFARTTDAKARICLYGTKETIKAFSNFEKIGAVMDTPERRRAFSYLVSNMRADSGAEKLPNIEDIEIILLGRDK